MVALRKPEQQIEIYIIYSSRVPHYAFFGLADDLLHKITASFSF